MINMIQLPRTAFDPDQVIIRALSSITSEQAGAIALIVQANGSAWKVQTVDDYDGYLSILIEPSISGNEQEALFISGTAQHFELFKAQDDVLSLVGAFADVETLGACLTDLLGPQ